MACDPTKLSELDLASRKELLEAVRRVHERRGLDSADVQDAREKILGFSWMGYNFMCDRALDGIIRPAEQFMRD